MEGSKFCQSGEYFINQSRETFSLKDWIKSFKIQSKKDRKKFNQIYFP